MGDSVTIRDVARLAGVSIATVSRFLNKNTVLSPDTAQKVQDAMRQLNYVPHAAARQLATNRTHTIGLLLTEITGDYFTLLLRGIERETRQSGYRLLISTCSGLEDGPDAPLALGPHNTDGLLVFLDTLPAGQLAGLVEKSFPVVLIHQTPPEGLPIPSVTIENKTSLVRVVDHLAQVHRRRFVAFLRGPEGNQDAAWRETGYREGLSRNHLPYNPDLVGYGRYDRRIAYGEVKRLVGAHPEIDAIFTGDDEGAIGTLSALQELGRAVPGEISVVGFDDQLMARFLSPPLTTIHAPTELVGQTAARQLIRLIQTGSADALTLLPTELILRLSCGCGAIPGDEL
jgi:LacI family transcriptional regulator